MKLFFYNDQINNVNCNGSFAIASRNLNQAAMELGCFGQIREADFIIEMDAFKTDTVIEGKKAIQFFPSEYNFAPKMVVDKLIKNNQFSLAISDQARNSFINAGLPENLIKTAHLGINPKAFPNLNQRARKFGDPLLYISNNTSNNRSSYNDFIPAWIEFAKGKNVKLIIKDQNNPRFAAIIKEIDKEQKIIYNNLNLSYEKLVHLYSKCHLGIYLNSVTSFGLTILEKVSSGIPVIVSNSTAIPEFCKEEHVTFVDCAERLVNNLLRSEWQSWGLTNNLLNDDQYCGQLITYYPKYNSILENLEYSYKNYLILLAKNQKFIQDIQKNLTWHHSIKKIVEILS